MRRVRPRNFPPPPPPFTQHRRFRRRVLLTPPSEGKWIIEYVKIVNNINPDISFAMFFDK